MRLCLLRHLDKLLLVDDDLEIRIIQGSQSHHDLQAHGKNSQVKTSMIRQRFRGQAAWRAASGTEGTGGGGGGRGGGGDRGAFNTPRRTGRAYVSDKTLQVPSSDGTRCCLQSGSNTSGTTHFLQLRFHITNRTLLCILTREDADSFYAQ